MVQLTFQHVTKTFPAVSRRVSDTIAVDDVSLAIPSGHLFFLLGPSGCGKTTLLRMIAGFVMPNSGQILFDQHDISRVPPYRRDTGMVFQSYALWPHLTVAQNVAFGLKVRKIKEPRLSQRVDDALGLVQLAHLKDRKPNQLSGGQQQRVALARALAIRPKCLLLDEPLSNLDAKLRLEMRTEIRRIVKQTGITAVYVTHDQKEAISMADGIALMRAGKIEQAGDPVELYRRPATRFVASFIGEANFLPAKVAVVQENKVLLQTVGGSLIALIPAGATYQKGQSVTAAFRPESVRLHHGPVGEGTNRLAGKFFASTYLGEAFEHVIEVPGGTRIKASSPNPVNSSPPAPGHSVVMAIAPEQVMVLPAGGEETEGHAKA